MAHAEPDDQAPALSPIPNPYHLSCFIATIAQATRALIDEDEDDEEEEDDEESDDELEELAARAGRAILREFRRRQQR